MSILEENNQQNNQNNQGAAAPSAARPAAAGGAQFAPNGARGLNALLGGVVSRSTTSDYLRRVYEVMKKKFDTLNADGQLAAFNILPFDGQAHQTVLSAIVTTMTVRDTKSNLITVIGRLVLEGSGPALPAAEYNFGGQNIEVARVAGDVDDEEFKRLVLAEVVRKSTHKPAQALDAGSFVLPEDFDLNDEAKVHEVFYHMLTAPAAVVDYSFGNPADRFQFDSRFLNPTSDTLQARLDPHPYPQTNAVGLPVRTDMAIELTAQSSGAANSSVSVGSAPIPLARTGVFVDLILQDNGDQVAPGFGMQVTQPRRFFVPHVIITQSVSALDRASREIDALHFLNAAVLATDYAWALPFRRTNNDGSDLSQMRDISALGLELPGLLSNDNVASRLPVAKFSNEDYTNFFRNCFHAAPIISIDVEEHGPLLASQSILLHAADQQSPRYREANLELHAVLNHLTRGAFGTLVPEGTAIVNPGAPRIHLGSYTDENGLERDIRDFDNLAMLNKLAERDPQLYTSWVRTFEDQSMSQPVALSTRLGLMQRLHPSLKLKGYARRVTINKDVINAMGQAPALAGYTIRLSNMVGSGVDTFRRGTINASALAMNAGRQAAFTPMGGNNNGRVDNFGVNSSVGTTWVL